VFSCRKQRELNLSNVYFIVIFVSSVNRFAFSSPGLAWPTTWLWVRAFGVVLMLFGIYTILWAQAIWAATGLVGGCLEGAQAGRQWAVPLGATSAV